MDGNNQGVEKVEAALWNLREASAFLGVSGKTLVRQSASGRAPAPLRIGRALRWRRSDLVEWIASGCRRCAPVGGGVA